MMSEQRFGWNYFENEVVIGDKQDKKRMIVIVLSNFMDIPYNKKSFDEIVTLLNEQQAIINKLNDELELTANTKLYSRRELERKVDEQQATINKLQKENIELKKLRKYCAEWMGVKEENLYDVVR